MSKTEAFDINAPREITELVTQHNVNIGGRTATRLFVNAALRMDPGGTQSLLVSRMTYYPGKMVEVTGTAYTDDKGKSVSNRIEVPMANVACVSRGIVAAE